MKYDLRLNRLLGCLLIILSLILPNLVSALTMIPGATLTIVVKANGIEDGTLLNFDIQGAQENIFENYSTFDIITEQNSATRSVFLTAFKTAKYIINLRSNLKLENSFCESIDSNNNFSFDQNSILLTVQAWQNVTCTFNLNISNSKTPVLIVPGVFGTEIQKDDTLLWADLERMVNPLNSDDFMDPLGFTKTLEAIEENLSIEAVIRSKTKKIGFKTFTLYNYSDSLINDFVAQGYTEGEDLFTFPYDWRYGVSGKDADGNEVNVKALDGQINYILNQTDAGRNAGKVDVIAHSTGGLIVKQYVMEHSDSHGIGKAIFVGVPNLGAPKAVKVLLQGDNFNIKGLNDSEMKKLAQNMPVVYDLAPMKNIMI